MLTLAFHRIYFQFAHVAGKFLFFLPKVGSPKFHQLEGILAFHISPWQAQPGFKGVYKIAFTK